MDGFEFAATLVKSLAWPLVAVAVLASFRIQIAGLVGKIASFKASKDGIEISTTMGEASMEVIGTVPAPEIQKEVEKKQVLKHGGNASGSYKLYANGVIVTRCMVSLSPGESSRQLVLPVAMVNEATSAQFIGDIQAKVVKLSQTGIDFEFAPSDVPRMIEVVVTGL